MSMNGLVLPPWFVFIFRIVAEPQTTDSVKTDLSYYSYRPCLKPQGSQRPRAQALKVQISDTSYEYSYEGSYKYKEDLHKSLGYEQT